MTGVFLEIVMDSKELAASSVEGRDEIEDPLHDLLSSKNLGEVTGGGGGVGYVNIDVEIFDETMLDESIAEIRKELKSIGVPLSTVIKRYSPELRIYNVYV